MTLQRRRGQEITFYPVIIKKDRRGNNERHPDLDNPIVTRCSTNADRSNKGEVPGQLTVDVIQVRVKMGLPNVDLFSRAYFKGDWWDMVSPPLNRFGRAGVQHDTFLLRKRPNDGRIPDKGVSPDG